MSDTPPDLVSLDEDYGIIQVSGQDCRPFLQGQLTCDMTTLQEGQSTLGAHCNREGRVLSFFHALSLHGSIYLITTKDMVPLTLKGLAKYAVFSKVTIQESHPFSLTGAQHDHFELRFGQASLSITLLSPPPHRILSTHAWHQARIRAGIPRLTPRTSGKFLPHELNLPAFHAVSVEKGCYTGQEIIARLHFRGKIKNHVHYANLQTETSLQPGDSLWAMDQHPPKPVGTIIDCQKKTSSTQHDILLVIPDQYATSRTLFCENDPNAFITFPSQD